MKRILGLLLATLLVIFGQVEPANALEPNTDFVGTWDTTKLSEGSSDEFKISLPLEETGTYAFTVNWGDSNTTVIDWDPTQPEGQGPFSELPITHSYDSPGIYEITISGVIKGFGFRDAGDKLKITNISNWGNLNFGNSGGYFSGAANLEVSATDAPDLTGTTNLGYTFAGAAKFNGAVGNWNVSEVTNISSIFENATSFNQPLNDWNVSKVTLMRASFYGATSFNQPLDKWNVSNVWHFGGTFQSATSFNQDISDWDVVSGGVANLVIENDVADYQLEMIGFFSNTAITPFKYGKMLRAWAALVGTYEDPTITAPDHGFNISAKYPDDSETVSAREYLVNQGWEINDAGPVTLPTQIGRSSSVTVSYRNDQEVAETFDSVTLTGNSRRAFTISDTDCVNLELEPGDTCTSVLTFSPIFEGHQMAELRFHVSGKPNFIYRSAGFEIFGTGSCEANGFAGGSGTALDPFEISNLNELNCINAYSVDNGYLYLSKSFKLVADIDLNNEADVFSGIGTWWYGFDGSFDGNGHSITGMKLTGMFASMFPWITGSTVIKNLTLIDPSINSNWDAAAITNYADGNARIENVHVVGGLVENTSGGWAGGLVGQAYNLTLTGSSSSANVQLSGESNEVKTAGGLVEQADSNTLIENSYSTGTVSYLSSGENRTFRLGGLVGWIANATIKNSYVTGLIGTDSLDQTSHAAGIAGYARSITVENSFSAAEFEMPETVTTAAFIGEAEGSNILTGNFWNSEVSSISTDALAETGKLEAKTTADMKNLATYQAANWDITQYSGGETVWVKLANALPQLYFEPAALELPSQPQNNNPTPTPSPTLVPPVVIPPITSNPPTSEGEPGDKPENILVGNLTVLEFKELTKDQISNFDKEDAKLITQAKLVVLTMEQIRAIPAAAISAIKPSAIAKLTLGKLKSLRAAQIKALTNKQIAALSSKQRRVIGL